MTREEILAMKPGREMDVAVAQAMGWTNIIPDNKGEGLWWR